MRRKGLSARLERHMERGEELMELNRVAFDRNTQAFERVMAALDRHDEVLDRHEQMFEENKIFVREMTRRNEKVVQHLLEGHQKFFSKLEADMEESRGESRAQTQALLALIDRLPPPAQAA